MVIWEKNAELHAELAEVDEYIRAGLKSKQKTLTEALEGLLNSGGKRIRPAMVLLSGKFGKFKKEKLIPLAAGVEILHMATLVHDDIIDESRLRRGAPTVQARYGKDIAVFTGDFLLTRAFGVITRKTSFENLQHLARVIKAICEGEIDQYESRYNRDVSLKHYLKRIGRKTALLFALSCHVGAQESKCSPAITRNLRMFGYNLGMAFQITDDLLDFSGTQQQVGKPVGSDFMQGVYTLPVIYALSRPVYQERILAVIDRNSYTPDEVEIVRQAVYECGGMDYARKLAERYLARARTHLNALPDVPPRGVLEELITELRERKY